MIPPLSHTDTDLDQSANSGVVRLSGNPSTWKLIAVAGAFFILLAAAGAVYRIQTDHGELVISVQDHDVQVVIKKGSKVVKIIDTKTGKTVTMHSGEYDLDLKGSSDKLRLGESKATIQRGKVTLVTVLPIPRNETDKAKNVATAGHPKEILQLWEGDWSNSLNESGETCCVLIEGPDGIVHGWWSNTKLTGKRISATTLELDGKSENRSYQFTATREGDVLTVKYIATLLDGKGESYDGRSVLTRGPADAQVWQGNWSNDRGMESEAVCFLSEDIRGNVQGNWDGVKITGNRVSPTAMSLKGTNGNRIYDITATSSDDVLTFQYITTNAAGQDYFGGQSKLKRVR